MMRKLLATIILCVLIFASVSFFMFYRGTSGDLKFEPTSIAISQIMMIKNLDVLTASIKYYNVMSIGPDSNPNYANIYSKSGTVVYSINLSEIKTYEALSAPGDQTLFVELPQIDATLYLDEKSSKMLDEYQKFGWSGTAEEGFKAKLVTDGEAYKKLQETLQGCDDLLLQAKESAKKQVTQLINSFNPKYKDIIVFFYEK